MTETRIRMLVEYDGSEFEGYQLQGPDVRSVQSELEKAFSALQAILPVYTGQAALTRECTHQGKWSMRM